MNAWTEAFEKLEGKIIEIRAAYLLLFTENEQLKAEAKELRAQRDYLQQMVDQTIGRAQ
jgi:hypothetical protein